MSRDRKTLKGPDGATARETIEAACVVRTTKGYALCTIRLASDGQLLSAELSESQAFKQYVAVTARAAQVKAAMKA